MSVKWQGEKEMQRKIEKLVKDAPEAVGAALWQNASDIMRVSTPKVPVDTGTLRRAWIVDKPKMRGSSISVDIGYGTHYALYVHERTELTHDNGEAKFLQKAIEEESGNFLNKLAKRAERNLERGITMEPKRETGPKYDGGVT